jgi:hypothetical protein
MAVEEDAAVLPRADAQRVVVVTMRWTPGVELFSIPTHPFKARQDIFELRRPGDIHWRLLVSHQPRID